MSDPSPPQTPAAESRPTPPASPATTPRALRLGSWRRTLWIALVLAAGLMAVGVLAASERPADPEPTGALPVAVVEAALKDRFELRERIAGRVVSRRRSELGFERGGRIAEILVDEGDRVDAGALLARLDTRELEAALREQQARRAATEARLELARATAERRRRLESQGTLSQQALDEALTEESSLAAQLEADRAAVERTRVALSLSRLEAPYPAIVVRRRQDEGSVAMPGEPLLSIIEDGTREVRLGVPPEVADGLEIGRRYPLERVAARSPAAEASGAFAATRTASASPITARLRHVLPEIDRATRTRTAIFEIEATEIDPIGLSDGTLVWVRLSRDVPGRGSWLPIGALAEGRRGTWTAYAVVADAEGRDRVERRVVEIVHVEGERAFVRGTLRDGDRIVADGLHRLIPGLAVRVVTSRADGGEDGEVAR